MTTSAATQKDIQKLQRLIVDALEDVKAQDIVVFNTEHLSPLFERVIIATGTSNRQTKSLASSVRDKVREAGLPKPRLEGEDNGEWIIVDCGPAVVHIMQQAIRQYYHLEELWGDKPVRLKLGAPKPLPPVAVKAAPTKDKPKSKEHKQKMREAQKGKPKKSTVYQTLEYKALMSKIKSGKGNARYGVEVSEETRRKISEAKKGKQVAHNKGVPMSEEQKALIRATKAANPTKMSAESIAQRVAKQTGQRREKLHCVHCNRNIAVGWFHRHGANCASIKP